jgi:hypothetical protein
LLKQLPVGSSKWALGRTNCPQADIWPMLARWTGGVDRSYLCGVDMSPQQFIKM